MVSRQPECPQGQRKRAQMQQVSGTEARANSSLSRMQILYSQIRSSLSSRQIPRAVVLRYLIYWINQCVGLRNERHFILFMFYFVVATSCFVVAGYSKVWPALDFGMHSWPHRTPEMVYLIIYIWKGVTTVEGYDHGIYADRAHSRGETFVNSYDLGFFKNLAYFFNVIPSGYPLWVLLLPLRTAPYTDGFVWARRQGYNKHGGVQEGEEMTDDED
ncbi:hypothetical protein RSOLAG22IIIB_01349 [Rhizoctonia solani]|uniref:Protein S-acyltransferase n=1 Tax=Rhizoctonia solani TaxID=456999 RepID=A0A0K6G5Q5_9AGAM|nr:hypothetical protein RSOLAG22IIIB_01349 [Rhizoctonia solani]